MTRNKYAERKTFSATEDWELDEASQETVSSWLIHGEADGSWSGTIDIQGRALGSDHAYANVGYKNMETGAIVAGTQLTTTFIALVDASGLDIQVSVSRPPGASTSWRTRSSGKWETANR